MVIWFIRHEFHASVVFDLEENASFDGIESADDFVRRGKAQGRMIKYLTNRWPKPTMIAEFRRFSDTDEEMMRCLDDMERFGFARKDGDKYWPTNAALAYGKKLMKCEKCGTTHEVKGYYHSGFSSLFYLYCSQDPTVLTIDEYDSQIWRILKSTGSSFLGDEEQALVENQLINCECGGTFSFSNPLRCPECRDILLGPFRERVTYAIIGQVVDGNGTNVWRRWASDSQHRWKSDDGRRSMGELVDALQAGRMEEIDAAVGRRDGLIDLRGIEADPSVKSKGRRKTRPLPIAPWMTAKYLCIESASILRTDFSNSQFREVELSNCCFEDCSFRDSRFIQLRNIANRFHRVDFSNCLFTDNARHTMSLGCSNEDQVTEYFDCDFSESTIHMAWGINPSFENCILEDIQMVNCDFIGAKFSGCTISGILNYVDFVSMDPPPEGIERRNYGAHSPSLGDIDFSRCELDDVSFSVGFDLSEATLPSDREHALIWHPASTFERVLMEFGDEFVRKLGEEWKGYIETEIGKESRRQRGKGQLRILNRESVARQWSKWEWIPETLDLLVKESRHTMRTKPTSICECHVSR